MSALPVSLTQKSQLLKYLLFLAFVALVLVMNNYIYGRAVGGFWGNYVLPCIFWGTVIVLIHSQSLPRPAAKLRYRPMLNWLAFLSGLAGVLTVYAAGLLEGFGSSPYELSLKGIVINILYLGTTTAGIEFSRSWFIHKIFKKQALKGIIIISLLYALFSFSLTRLNSLSSKIEIVKFIGKTCLPAFSESTLATYLAFLGGPLPALVYRGTLQAFHWFMPVLPDLGWLTQALLDTFVPALSLAMVYHIYIQEAEKNRKKEKGNPIGWVTTSILSILLIWFAVGVFNIFPTAIVSGSMAPAIKTGDIVIVKRLPAGEIMENDIIQFRGKNASITHRVIAIKETEQGIKAFQTKGDANNSPDTELVYPEQIMGKVVYVIPKAGWITIALRNRR
ncbi:MAG: signal peptidase I [Firmicutes bacterium]|nr:signal peptidase I [Bacillota bacterium]